MKFKIMTLVTMAILILPSIAEAQPLPAVKWKPVWSPLGTVGQIGNTISMEGKVSVDSDSPISWTGRLKFQIWGTVPIGQSCNVVCGGPPGFSGDPTTCYDFEACNGENCGAICISGSFPSGANTNCGEWDECLDTVECGYSCDDQYAGAGSGGCVINGVQNNNCETEIITLQPGEESNTFKFEKSIGNWPEGSYVSNLFVIDDRDRVLDLEFVDFIVDSTGRYQGSNNRMTEIETLNMIFLIAGIMGIISTIILVANKYRKGGKK